MAYRSPFMFPRPDSSCFQRERQEKQRAACGRVSGSQRTPVGGNNFFGHRESQTVVALFAFGRGRIGLYAVKAVENFPLFFVGDARTVILHADGDFLFIGTLSDEQQYGASRGRVGERVVQKNMTHLSYSACIAGAERQFVVGQADRKQMSAVGGQRQEVFVGFEEQRL